MLVGNCAKLVDPGDERPDETQVDKRHEYCGLASGLSTEEGGDCPSSSENGDNEKSSMDDFN